ncbi:MAG: (2Fe-2S)-binding protein [Methylomonas sp.]
MYICLCQAVTERDIEEATLSGVRTLEGLRRELQLGTECGRCTDAARQCLKSARHCAGQQLRAA